MGETHFQVRIEQQFYFAVARGPASVTMVTVYRRPTDATRAAADAEQRARKCGLADTRFQSVNDQIKGKNNA